MEADGVSKAEDGTEEPGSKDEGRLDAAQSDCPPGGQSQGPTALWEMVERKFLEYRQLAPGSPVERHKSLLSLLPLFLKVGVLLFEAVSPHSALGILVE